MRITWLGQAGLLFDSGSAKVMIDPYLSDSVGKKDAQKHRRVPVDTRFLACEPDVLLFTHDHLDHYDPETVSHLLGEGRKAKTVLCPSSVWHKVREYGGAHNYVLLDRGSEWTEHGFCFRAFMAAHSDPYAIGVILEAIDEGKVFYITGDTLYHRELLSALPDNIDTVFLPVNGVGNNMNATDAVRFFRAVRAKHAVPYHIGMFDGLTHEVFQEKNKIVFELYKEKEI